MQSSDLDVLLRDLEIFESRIDSYRTRDRIPGFAIPSLASIPSIPSLPSYAMSTCRKVVSVADVPPLPPDSPPHSVIEDQLVQQLNSAREESNRLSRLLRETKGNIREFLTTGNLSSFLQYSADLTNIGESRFVEILLLLIRNRYAKLWTGGEQLRVTESSAAQVTQVMDTRTSLINQIVPQSSARNPNPAIPFKTRVYNSVELRSKINQCREIRSHKYMTESQTAHIDSAALADAVRAYRAGDLDGAVARLVATENVTDTKNLVSRLIACKVLEESGNFESAENGYLEILESFTDIGLPCPLGLFHYLQFIARTRSVEESLSFFDDLFFAESEHVTSEVFAPVAIGIAWSLVSSSPADRFEKSVEIFRKGLSRSKGAKRTELVISFSNFWAFTSNHLKQAELELAKHVSESGPAAAAADSPVWATWEAILLEFNADLNTIKSMHAMRDLVASEPGVGLTSVEKTGSLVEDAITGMVTISDFPETDSVNSWLLASGASPTVHSVIRKFSIGQNLIVPSTAVLESVLGRSDLLLAESVEVRDGGSEPTNHVYRPDVTRMLKYNPNDFAEKRVMDVAGLPVALKNLIAVLPSNRPLKCANNQYIADQCIRLLVSITLPSRTEEMFANVDKRTRAAIEQKFAPAKPKITAAQIAPAVLAAAPEAPAPRVKKEEIFDPVDYYNRK